MNPRKDYALTVLENEREVVRSRLDTAERDYGVYGKAAVEMMKDRYLLELDSLNESIGLVRGYYLMEAEHA